MEWHWFYIIGIVWIVVNVYALMSSKPVDEDLEKMWDENL